LLDDSQAADAPKALAQGLKVPSKTVFYGIIEEKDRNK
jgi:hypothetical protein